MKPFRVPAGATPIHDMSGLKPSWVVSLPQLNEVEGENILAAIRKYLFRSGRRLELWFSPTVLRKIHREMLCDVWEWAGQYRKASTNIGSSPYLIPMEVMELCRDVCFWSEDAAGMSHIEQAARVHHRLVAIHPFENGNGRFARLVGDMVLHSYGEAYPHWPSNLGADGAARREYIDALQAADAGEYVALVDFIERFRPASARSAVATS